jgi:hypothetical protein
MRERSKMTYIVPILVIVTGVVAYYILTASGTAGGGSSLVGQPVSAAVLDDLSGVSISTLNQVGKGGS